MWRRHSLVRLLLLPLPLLLSAHLRAQERVERLNGRITVGTRIRLELPGVEQRLEGTVRALGPDSIEVADHAGATRHASLAGLDSVQVFQRSASFATALGGAGFVAGTAMYLSWCERNPVACQEDGEDPDEWDDEDDDERYSMFKFMAFGTAFIGAAIGHALTPRRWHTVPIRIFVAPVRGTGETGGAGSVGAALYVSIPFGGPRRR